MIKKLRGIAFHEIHFFKFVLSSQQTKITSNFGMFCFPFQFRFYKLQATIVIFYLGPI